MVNNSCDISNSLLTENKISYYSDHAWGTWGAGGWPPGAAGWPWPCAGWAGPGAGASSAGAGAGMAGAGAGKVGAGGWKIIMGAGGWYTGPDCGGVKGAGDWGAASAFNFASLIMCACLQRNSFMAKCFQMTCKLKVLHDRKKMIINTMVITAAAVMVATT